MATVYIHTNENGGVSVTIPTEEALQIMEHEEIMAKDCPDHAILIDDSELPQGDDDKFFNAWELNNGVVTVNMDKAKAIHLANYNFAATQAAQARHLNTLTGIPNTIDDSTWLANRITDRTAISEANTTTQLLAIAFPSP